MPKQYTHLTQDQRCQINALLESKISKDEIALQLSVHRSTIYREIKRNKGQRGYRYQQAHIKSEERRSRASCRSSLKMTPAMIEKIRRALVEEQWSPEQISGRFKSLGLPSVSHETIYQHVWADKKRGGDQYKYLRHRGKKYNKRGAKQSGRGLIPGRVDISERPEVVDKKLRIGDWELDTIIGQNHQGAIVSIVDRVSKYTLLYLVEKKNSKQVSEAIIKELMDLKDLTFTLTVDNGKEFAKHKEIAKALGASVFFAKPYSSWERGLNEHTNGLVRQYFPKKTRFDTITNSDVKDVERKLNSRPRKVLNFKTPSEVFHQAPNFVALRG